jgi:hypothetical protein
MFMRLMTIVRYAAISCWVLFALSGCDATVELTKAPFDATTHLTDGTTNASSEFLEPTKEFSSSTTPGSWLQGGNPAKARRKVEVFVVYTYDNLRSDISQGHGEYLSSLASLAGVPQEQQTAFQSHMRNSYASMFDEELPVRESTARVVEAAWSDGFGRR